ncbi:MAG TPA: hypothetical protein VGA61_16165 [Anaerolineae bacterium]
MIALGCEQGGTVTGDVLKYALDPAEHDHGDLWTMVEQKSP